MSTHTLQTPPDDLAGKFLAIFEPLKPRTLLHVEPIIYEIVEKKGDKQVMIRTAFVPPGAEDKPRSKTTLGDNVAAFLPTLDAAKIFLAAVGAFRSETEMRESKTWRELSSLAVAQAAPTVVAPRSRTRAPQAVSTPQESTPAPVVRTRTRQPVTHPDTCPGC